MTLHVNDGGTWKSGTPYANDAGTWKAVKEGWVNDAGTWKQFYASVTYTPADGSYGVDTTVNAGFYTISASAPVVWTWSKVGQGTATVANGGTASQITFNVNAGNSCTFNVSSGGHSWTIDFTGAV